MVGVARYGSWRAVRAHCAESASYTRCIIPARESERNDNRNRKINLLEIEIKQRRHVAARRLLPAARRSVDDCQMEWRNSDGESYIKIGEREERREERDCPRLIGLTVREW